LPLRAFAAGALPGAFASRALGALVVALALAFGVGVVFAFGGMVVGAPGTRLVRASLGYGPGVFTLACVTYK
jgi:hypothetical protein